MIIWQLFSRFLLVSVLAFGGGSGIPLIEGTAVRESKWIDQRDFTSAIALAQILPGPVMVVASFVGYRVAGMAGAAAASLGVFLFPWASAAAFARHSERLARHEWLLGFGRGAAAAAVGLFGVTALSIARQSLEGWTGAVIAVATFALALATKIHPFWLILGGAILSFVVASHR
jgi:chromate transporter